MKKSSFILGLIAGIVGMISCGVLVFNCLNMPADKKGIDGVLIIGIIALILQVVGFIFGIKVEEKTKTAGLFMIIAGIADLVTSFAAASIDQIAVFMICLITFILFLVAGIPALKSKNTSNNIKA